jgi:hypothetical protein
MKVKKWTITQADLNIGDYIELDFKFIQGIAIYYPKGVNFINDTGATLGYLYLANDTEKAETLTLPTYYEYLQLPSGETTFDLPATSYLRIKLLSGIASADLTIYTFSYITWKDV